METQQLLQIIELLKQHNIQQQNNHQIQINKMRNIIFKINQENEYYKNKLYEFNNSFDNSNYYIDKLEHTCSIQNHELERLKVENKSKKIINKK